LLVFLLFAEFSHLVWEAFARIKLHPIGNGLEIINIAGVSYYGVA
jgi:hypothetical protein